MIKVFIGYDPNEVRPFHVLSQSIQDLASVPVSITPVRLSQLSRIHDRPRHPLASTEFSISRFLVPHLSEYTGWSIFMDCDFLCLADIAELWKQRDHRYDVMVCQHDHQPDIDTKFLGAVQTKYGRKNWSSLMMFNNAKCRALTPDYVNAADGLDLHQFKWAEQVGPIPLEWNWLVDVYDRNQDAKMVHYTNGGPYFSEYATCDYSTEWWEAYGRMNYVTQTTDIRGTGT